jgi:hypothetical protein
VHFVAGAQGVYRLYKTREDEEHTDEILQKGDEYMLWLFDKEADNAQQKSDGSNNFKDGVNGHVLLFLSFRTGGTN